MCFLINSTGYWQSVKAQHHASELKRIRKYTKNKLIASKHWFHFEQDEKKVYGIEMLVCNTILFQLPILTKYWLKPKIDQLWNLALHIYMANSVISNYFSQCFISQTSAKEWVRQWLRKVRTKLLFSTWDVWDESWNYLFFTW